MAKVTAKVFQRGRHWAFISYLQEWNSVSVGQMSWSFWLLCEEIKSLSINKWCAEHLCGSNTSEGKKFHFSTYYFKLQK
jgi:hypothetical protein